MSRYNPFGISGLNAEAEFYDLAYSVRKEEKAFDAEKADAAMAYALVDILVR